MPNKRRLLVLIPIALIFSLVILAVAAFFILEYHATTTVKQEIDKNIQEISQYIQVDYDRVGVNWLAFTVNMHKVVLSKPPLPGIITIDRVSVRDLTSIGIKWIPTVVVLDNIVVNNKDASLGVQRLSTSFSLKQIPSQEELANDWKVFLENLRAGTVQAEGIGFSDKKNQVQIGRGEAYYSLAGGNQRNSSLTINDLKLLTSDLKVHFDTFKIAAALNQDNVLTSITKQVKNFSFQIPPELASRYTFFQKVNALGYDRLTLGIDLDYNYQPQTQDMSLVWNASAENMGRLQLNLQLNDYQSPRLPLDGSLAKFLNFLEQLRPPVHKASLQGFKAVYQDWGLAPRLIKAEAQSRGKSPEQFTRNLVGAINASLMFLPLPPAIKEQVNSVNRFLLNPKEIQLAVTCKKPVPLKNLEEGSLTGLLELFWNTEVKITAQ